MWWPGANGTTTTEAAHGRGPGARPSRVAARPKRRGCSQSPERMKSSRRGLRARAAEGGAGGPAWVAASRDARAPTAKNSGSRLPRRAGRQISHGRSREEETRCLESRLGVLPVARTSLPAGSGRVSLPVPVHGAGRPVNPQPGTAAPRQWKEVLRVAKNPTKRCLLARKMLSTSRYASQKQYAETGRESKTPGGRTGFARAHHAGRPLFAAAALANGRFPALEAQAPGRHRFALRWGKPFGTREDHGSLSASPVSSQGPVRCQRSQHSDGRFYTLQFPARA